MLSAAVAVAAAAVALLATLLAFQPAFYRQAMAAGGAGPDADARARRMVTKASALHAAISRSNAPAGRDGQPSRWEAAIRADELNAWLAIDLPRSHPDWLPRGASAPRVGFRPRHATLAARVAVGPLSAVASVDFEIVLRDVDQLAVAVEQARLGALPIPRDAILRELARRLEKLGLVADTRRLDGRLVLMVHLAGAAAGGRPPARVDSLTLVDGELLVAGATGSHPEPRPGGVSRP